jgi:hypothetical protein
MVSLSNHASISLEFNCIFGLIVRLSSRQSPLFLVGAKHVSPLPMILPSIKRGRGVYYRGIFGAKSFAKELSHSFMTIILDSNDFYAIIKVAFKYGVANICSFSFLQTQFFRHPDPPEHCRCCSNSRI